jgi:hypothetical protein
MHDGEISDTMKKYYVILVVVIALSLITTAAFWWSNEQSAQQLVHIYHKGDQIPDTVYTFDGFTYMPPTSHTPPYGSSPMPTNSSGPSLAVVFKLNAEGESDNQSPGIHVSYPAQIVMNLNLAGNTTTDLGYTIVAYNEAAQTISMVHDVPA